MSYLMRGNYRYNTNVRNPYSRSGSCEECPCSEAYPHPKDACNTSDCSHNNFHNNKMCDCDCRDCDCEECEHEHNHCSCRDCDKECNPAVCCQDIPQPECENLCSLSLAMAYVPFQRDTELYPLDRGFRAGTIFPCLDKPFIGKGGCC